LSAIIRIPLILNWYQKEFGEHILNGVSFTGTLGFGQVNITTSGSKVKE